ncbi:G-type lectin S-receptor-like serine/threonine-protein kinase LECRK1 [Thalictrum thalictroides]|uniref:G-type lectin S-receptor-like serine/threonine-protein kinase LECRK1 n=1 Tax=Thalictrum thalictroides TaxID=46969 RepID=A0A7J6VRE7_THATH|nr:G-type lectin S-receptor-like serine/threonine-protein kinase LECRK1 [Thalictrum thalictroides]
MNSQCNLLHCFYAFFISFFVIFSFVLSEPSPIDNNYSSSTFNITKDSSLSTDNGRRYCLSPSGIFAFGFYPIRDQNGTIQYNVGIWNHKSLKQTLVWIANRDDSPFSGPSSLAFNKKGNLVRVSDNRTLSVVCSVQGEELATYGVIHDDGNFVLYNSKGNVVWESFNNPTDTILPGQILKSDSALVSSKSPSDHSSGRYKLSIDKYGICFIQIIDNNRTTGTIINSFQSQVNLTWNGDVLVINENGLVVDNFTKEGRLKDDDDLKNGTLMYRAKLDWDGKFRVYREEINANIEKSWEIEVFSYRDLLVFFRPFLVFFLVFALYATFFPEKDENTTTCSSWAMNSTNSNQQCELDVLSDSRSSESTAFKTVS